MATLFGSFGVGSLSGGGRFVHDIKGASHYNRGVERTLDKLPSRRQGRNSLTSKGQSPFFGTFFENWAGHCGCNICLKKFNFLDKYCIHNGQPKLQNGPKNGHCPFGVKIYKLWSLYKFGKKSLFT
jgi:hypothetical protein